MYIIIFFFKYKIKIFLREIRVIIFYRFNKYLIYKFIHLALLCVLQPSNVYKLFHNYFTDEINNKSQ